MEQTAGQTVMHIWLQISSDVCEVAKAELRAYDNGSMDFLKYG